MDGDGRSWDYVSTSTCDGSVGIFWVNGGQLVGFSRLCALVTSQSAVPHMGIPLGTGLPSVGAVIFFWGGGYMCPLPVPFQVLVLLL